ncbi:MAG: thiolase family protein [Candidatus Puniceispirillaceae bacterium]
MESDIVITHAHRTAMGSFQGALASKTAPELGGHAIAAVLANAARMNSDIARHIDEVIMGCVLPAGLGQAPARQAGFHGGLGDSIPATTVNKMCGSGMKAVMLGVDQLRGGDADLIIAGGMESMTNAPYLSPGTRGGARLGHQTFSDHMFLDGLEDAYDKGKLMGCFAEDCATHYQFSRQAQDDYALTSLSRAIDAQRDGISANEITPVEVSYKKHTQLVAEDEQPQTAQPEKIPHLKPAFQPDGSVTAANSSSISDGAAACLLTRRAAAEQHGLPVRAQLLGHASFAHAPGWFTTAPVTAAKKLLGKIGWQIKDVDLWEVNEAFAVVPMAFMRELDISHDIVNIHGGACALGHPIGASGARIIVTLLNALEVRGKKRGLAAICLGGGEGIAVALERP